MFLFNLVRRVWLLLDAICDTMFGYSVMKGSRSEIMDAKSHQR